MFRTSILPFTAKKNATNLNLEWAGSLNPFDWLWLVTGLTGLGFIL